MIPCLYKSTEPLSQTAFSNLGLGELPDALSCTVTDELNGLRYLEMEYPVDGLRYSEIAIGRIIRAAISRQSSDIFVIDNIDYSIDGVVKIYAPAYACLRLSSAVRVTENESYTWTKGDASTGDDIHDVMSALGSNVRPQLSSVFDGGGQLLVPGMVFKGNFDLPSGTSVKIDWGKEKPTAFELIQAIATAFGGEIRWRGSVVRILQNSGTDTGLEIRYGVNMIALDAEIDGESYATAVLPKDGSANSYVRADSPGAFPFFKLTVADLEGTTASAYLEESQTLRTAIKVQFDPYGNAIGAETDPEWLHKLGVGDIVTVVHPVLELKQKAKLVKATFNVLTERFESVDIGELMQDITDTIAALIRGK